MDPCGDHDQRPAIVALPKWGAVGFLKREAVETSDNGRPLLIGAIGKGFWPFNGLMDELVIHKRALTEVEIERRASYVPDIVEPAGPPSITLLSPRGGESLSGGSWHRIRWTSQKVSLRDPVKVEWSGDDGKAWTEIAASAPNTGEFVWQAVNAPSPHCRMRVSTSPSKLVTQNDRAFSIVPAQDVPAYEWVKVTLAAPSRLATAWEHSSSKDACGCWGLESQRQATFPPHLQQRGLEFPGRRGMDSRKAEYVQRQSVRFPNGLGGAAHGGMRRAS